MSYKEATTITEALAVVEMAVDYYHSMDLGEDGSPHWLEWWQAGMDIIDRIQGMPENTYYNSHIHDCESCQERNYKALPNY